MQGKVGCMFSRVCLIHYHEIGLKGKNRSTFERQLIQNLKHGLRAFDLAGVDRISGHVRIRVKNGDCTPELARAAAKIPGVARVSLAYCVEQDKDQICEAAVLALSHIPHFSTFKVHAHKSSTNFELHTLEINCLVGEALCKAFPDKKVQMHKPDVQLDVQVVNNVAYVYAVVEQSLLAAGYGALDFEAFDDNAVLSLVGVGGLPVGSAGKVVTLLSSGFDSPVATWMVGRRGAVCIPLHFSGRPQTADTSEYLTRQIVSALDPTGCIGRLYVCPFGDQQREISLCVPQSLRIICYRRIMFAVAEKLALAEGAKALVTGESLGQVASQTLDNIAAVNEMVSLPVLRPLIGSDKQEIIKRSLQIGTYDISSKPSPDCCTLFMPRRPETHAKLDAVHEAWDSFDHAAMIDELFDHIEYIDYDSCYAYHSCSAKRAYHRELCR